MPRPSAKTSSSTGCSFGGPPEDSRIDPNNGTMASDKNSQASRDSTNEGAASEKPAKTQAKHGSRFWGDDSDDESEIVPTPPDSPKNADTDRQSPSGTSPHTSTWFGSFGSGMPNLGPIYPSMNITFGRGNRGIQAGVINNAPSMTFGREPTFIVDNVEYTVNSYRQMLEKKLDAAEEARKRGEEGRRERK